MQDVINDITKFMDKDEINISSFIKNYNEIDIIKLFLYDLDKTNYKFKDFKMAIDSSYIHADGVYYSYCETIYTMTMRLIFNFDNTISLLTIEAKLNKISNIHSDCELNFKHCKKCIKLFIKYLINNFNCLNKYKNFIRTIYYIILDEINCRTTIAFPYV
jgi:hypothetical protein